MMTHSQPEKQMTNHYKGMERRKFDRYPFAQTFRFQTPNPASPNELPQMGKCKNISGGGMHFRAVHPVPRKSFITIELDKKNFKEQLPFDKPIITIQGQITAKVIWTHLNLENGLFEIGAQFVRDANEGNKKPKEAHRHSKVFFNN